MKLAITHTKKVPGKGWIRGRALLALLGIEGEYELIGIQIHLIVGDGEYASFKDQGLR